MNFDFFLLDFNNRIEKDWCLRRILVEVKRHALFGNMGWVMDRQLDESSGECGCGEPMVWNISEVHVWGNEWNI